jgi:hypothetical protein
MFKTQKQKFGSVVSRFKGTCREGPLDITALSAEGQKFRYLLTVVERASSIRVTSILE